MLESLSGTLARWLRGKSSRASGSNSLQSGTYVTLLPNEAIRLGPIDGTTDRLLISRSVLLPAALPAGLKEPGISGFRRQFSATPHDCRGAEGWRKIL
jgi:hypothetical protein